MSKDTNFLVIISTIPHKHKKVGQTLKLEKRWQKGAYTNIEANFYDKDYIQITVEWPLNSLKCSSHGVVPGPFLDFWGLHTGCDWCALESAYMVEIKCYKSPIRIQYTLRHGSCDPTEFNGFFPRGCMSVEYGSSTLWLANIFLPSTRGFIYVMWTRGQQGFP